MVPLKVRMPVNQDTPASVMGSSPTGDEELCSCRADGDGHPITIPASIIGGSDFSPSNTGTNLLSRALHTRGISPPHLKEELSEKKGFFLPSDLPINAARNCRNFPGSFGGFSDFSIARFSKRPRPHR